MIPAIVEEGSEREARSVREQPSTAREPGEDIRSGRGARAQTTAISALPKTGTIQMEGPGDTART